MTQRTILFRGKSVKNGQWVEGDLIQSNDQYNHKTLIWPINTSTTDNMVGVDPATVGQFTGNKDTNGTMVWEGSTIENCDTKDLQEVYWNLNESAWYCRYIGQNRIVSLADSLGNLNTVIK
jgi:hypothetical protein